ncbi:uncharacterized protein [Panulirus ornatus]|uniref:uncharacterized protein n=1 Tax=Panulirus ornatus TaxID=150431 RepID=UPI003A887301
MNESLLMTPLLTRIIQPPLPVIRGATVLPKIIPIQPHISKPTTFLPSLGPLLHPGIPKPVLPDVSGKNIPPAMYGFPRSPNTFSELNIPLVEHPILPTISKPTLPDLAETKSPPAISPITHNLTKPGITDATGANIHDVHMPRFPNIIKPSLPGVTGVIKPSMERSYSPNISKPIPPNITGNNIPHILIPTTSKPHLPPSPDVIPTLQTSFVTGFWKPSLTIPQAPSIPLAGTSVLPSLSTPVLPHIVKMNESLLMTPLLTRIIQPPLPVIRGATVLPKIIPIQPHISKPTTFLPSLGPLLHPGIPKPVLPDVSDKNIPTETFGFPRSPNTFPKINIPLVEHSVLPTISKPTLPDMAETKSPPAISPITHNWTKPGITDATGTNIPVVHMPIFPNITKASLPGVTQVIKPSLESSYSPNMSKSILPNMTRKNTPEILVPTSSKPHLPPSPDVIPTLQTPFVTGIWKPSLTTPQAPSIPLAGTSVLPSLSTPVLPHIVKMNDSSLLTLLLPRVTQPPLPVASKSNILPEVIPIHQNISKPTSPNIQTTFIPSLGPPLLPDIPKSSSLDISDENLPSAKIHVIPTFAEANLSTNPETNIPVLEHPVLPAMSTPPADASTVPSESMPSLTHAPIRNMSSPETLSLPIIPHPLSPDIPAYLTLPEMNSELSTTSEPSTPHMLPVRMPSTGTASLPNISKQDLPDISGDTIPSLGKQVPPNITEPTLDTLPEGNISSMKPPVLPATSEPISLPDVLESESHPIPLPMILNGSKPVLPTGSTKTNIRVAGVTLMPNILKPSLSSKPEMRTQAAEPSEEPHIPKPSFTEISGDNVSHTGITALPTTTRALLPVIPDHVIPSPNKPMVPEIPGSDIPTVRVHGLPDMSKPVVSVLGTNVPATMIKPSLPIPRGPNTIPERLSVPPTIFNPSLLNVLRARLSAVEPQGLPTISQPSLPHRTEANLPPFEIPGHPALGKPSGLAVPQIDVPSAQVLPLLPESNVTTIPLARPVYYNDTVSNVPDKVNINFSLLRMALFSKNAKPLPYIPGQGKPLLETPLPPNISKPTVKAPVFLTILRAPLLSNMTKPSFPGISGMSLNRAILPAVIGLQDHTLRFPNIAKFDMPRNVRKTILNIPSANVSGFNKFSLGVPGLNTSLVGVPRLKTLVDEPRLHQSPHSVPAKIDGATESHYLPKKMERLYDPGYKPITPEVTIPTPYTTPSFDENISALLSQDLARKRIFETSASTESGASDVSSLEQESLKTVRFDGFKPANAKMPGFSMPSPRKFVIPRIGARYLPDRLNTNIPSMTKSIPPATFKPRLPATPLEIYPVQNTIVPIFPNITFKDFHPVHRFASPDIFKSLLQDRPNSHATPIGRPVQPNSLQHVLTNISRPSMSPTGTPVVAPISEPISPKSSVKPRPTLPILALPNNPQPSQPMESKPRTPMAGKMLVPPKEMLRIPETHNSTSPGGVNQSESGDVVSDRGVKSGDARNSSTSHEVGGNTGSGRNLAGVNNTGRELEPGFPGRFGKVWGSGGSLGGTGESAEKPDGMGGSGDKVDVGGRGGGGEGGISERKLEGTPETPSSLTHPKLDPGRKRTSSATVTTLMPPVSRPSSLEIKTRSLPETLQVLAPARKELGINQTTGADDRPKRGNSDEYEGEERSVHGRVGDGGEGVSPYEDVSELVNGKTKADLDAGASVYVGKGTPGARSDDGIGGLAGSEAPESYSSDGTGELEDSGESGNNSVNGHGTPAESEDSVPYTSTTHRAFAGSGSSAAGSADGARATGRRSRTNTSIDAGADDDDAVAYR